MSLATSASTSAPLSGLSGPRPRALVYRGPCVSDGCSEAVAQLLESSPRHFHVQFAGPNEAVKVSPDSLNGVQLYAQPGGPDLDDAWAETKASKKAIRDFVSGGGRYLGFCLGAYLAGRNPGFGLLPKGADTDSENDMKGAQVTDDRDTVIQVDWAFVAGDKAGQVTNRWIFFQEGAVMRGFKESETAIVLGRYSTSGRIAATLNKYGDGWVGLTGPHPEATDEWFSVNGVKSPHGVQFDIGYDLIEAVMTGKGPETTVPESKPNARSKFRNPLSRFFGT